MSSGAIDLLSTYARLKCIFLANLPLKENLSLVRGNKIKGISDINFSPTYLEKMPLCVKIESNLDTFSRKGDRINNMG